MKKLFPVLLAVALFSTACQLGGGQAEPTPIALPTAGAVATPIPLNPTAESASADTEAGSERVSSADGMIQVFIPEGTFQMGGIDQAAAQDEKPAHQVTMHAFWMDKIEVTNAMYADCVQAGGCTLPYAFKTETRQSYFNNPEFADFPVVYVGWGQADAYCKWAGRRLPTEAEWERAARGDDFRAYPWGDDRPTASYANFNYYFGDTNRVGSYPSGASPFGVFDMAGNVGEWVQDFYDGDYYNSAINNNPPGPAARTNYFNRVVRGGSYADDEAYIRVSKRSSVRGPDINAKLDSPEYIGEYASRIGFRCAANN
jgi:formylglycine-generating enzyme required for sulfatase activity